ncbi:MAG: hypothetical protein H5U04_00900 [Firmicutes bacterium]|nr:hypothetical protein [Bacillota bacterium]
MAEDDKGPRRNHAGAGRLRRRNEGRSAARQGLRYGLIMAALAFGISLGLAVPTQALTSRLGIIPAVFAILVVVAVGVVFDIVGVATAAASEAPFHARAAKKKPGARQALWMVRNAEKVNNFCADVVGDVCGTLSGAAASTLVVRLVTLFPHAGHLMPQVLVVSSVAALTIGGKAACKGLAIRRSEEIVTWAGNLLYRLHLLPQGNNGRPRPARLRPNRGRPRRRQGTSRRPVTGDGSAVQPRRAR